MIVAHVITRFVRGGADENTLLTCNGQAALGHEVHLIYGDHHPDMVAAMDPRVRMHHLPSMVRAVRPWTDLRCLRALARLFRELRPDVVHTHESKAGVLGRFAAVRARVSVIVHGVHILPFVGVGQVTARIYLALEKAAARVTDAYVDVSAGMRDICLEHGLGRSENHFVVASGMDVARFRAAVPLPRNSIVPGRSFAAGCTIGLISGALEPRKRVAELIAALGASPPAGDWALLIAGAGPEADAIARTIATHGLQDRVFPLGFCGNLPELIATADVCLHVARNEGLPRVVVQYVLGGRPVVTSALPGIDRVVQDGVNGVLVPVITPQAAATVFARLVDACETRRAYADASRKADLSDWGADTMVTRIEQVYAWVADQKQTR
jgi:glycosyltransferase involved in cell wall biosynthesis